MKENNIAEKNIIENLGTIGEGIGKVITLFKDKLITLREILNSIDIENFVCSI